jgi:hypothetical protein
MRLAVIHSRQPFAGIAEGGNRHSTDRQPTSSGSLGKMFGDGATSNPQAANGTRMWTIVRDNVVSGTIRYCPGSLHRDPGDLPAT